jgi:hypothetical protein
MRIVRAMRDIEDMAARGELSAEELHQWREMKRLMEEKQK